MTLLLALIFASLGSVGAVIGAAAILVAERHISWILLIAAGARATGCARAALFPASAALAATVIPGQSSRWSDSDVWCIRHEKKTDLH